MYTDFTPNTTRGTILRPPNGPLRRATVSVYAARGMRRSSTVLSASSIMPGASTRRARSDGGSPADQCMPKLALQPTSGKVVTALTNDFGISGAPTIFPPTTRSHRLVWASVISVESPPRASNRLGTWYSNGPSPFRPTVTPSSSGVLSRTSRFSPRSATSMRPSPRTRTLETLVNSWAKVTTRCGCCGRAGAAINEDENKAAKAGALKQLGRLRMPHHVTECQGQHFTTIGAIDDSARGKGSGEYRCEATAGSIHSRALGE